MRVHLCGLAEGGELCMKRQFGVGFLHDFRSMAAVKDLRDGASCARKCER